MMRKLVFASAISLCFLLGVILYRSTLKLTPYEQGKAEARRDLGQGKLMIRAYGGPSSAGPNSYDRILLNDYSITVDHVAGCIVTDDITSRAAGYNEVSIDAIHNRYGQTVLERVKRDADREDQRLIQEGWR